jgi:UDP:flavonoid glycosyltransferase YjiC (YdhE family)
MSGELPPRSRRRFLFTVAGGYGHFHPLVPLARALKARGHEVAFASGASTRSVVEAAGFDFLQLGGKLADLPEYRQLKDEMSAMPPGLDTELFIYTHLWCGLFPCFRTPFLVEAVRQWQPDMLVRETGEYATAIAAEHLGLPHATVAVLASLQAQAIFERDAATQLDPIRRDWGLPPDPTLSALYRYLLISYAPPAFSTHDVGAGELDLPGATGATRPIPATTRFVRPQFFDQAAGESLPGWFDSMESGRPTVYATLGTEINKEPGIYPDALQTIIAGLRGSPINLVVTLGRGKDPADFGPQPPNVHIEPYIPQSLLLPRCDLMVMHGGSNSLMQSLDVALPVVVLPFIADQFYNAAIAQDLQVGQVVRTWHPGHPGNVDLAQLTPASVQAAVQEVLDNPTYRQNAALLQAEMRALPGEAHAVELVERVATTREPVPNGG